MNNLNFDGNNTFKIMVDKNKISVYNYDKTTNTKTVGVAKCHKDDKFNFYYGLELAMGRCNLKTWYKKLDKTSKEISKMHLEEDELKKNIDELEQYIMYVTNELSKQKDSIRELLVTNPDDICDRSFSSDF